MRNRSYFKRMRFNKGIYVLPNIFTTANLFCGFYAIIAAMKQEFQIAAIFIVFSLILDVLDGRIARITKTTSKFGSEYDSLVDLVAFGMAPAILLYNWSLLAYGRIGWLIAFLFVACGALRLARFNVQIGLIESKVFNGLPIPGAASVVATMILFYYYLGGEGDFKNPVILFLVTALSLLMVSSIKYYSFKDMNVLARKPFTSFVLIVLIMIIIVAEPQMMLFAFALGYSISGPAWHAARWVNKQRLEARQKIEKSENKEHLV